MSAARGRRRRARDGSRRALVLALAAAIVVSALGAFGAVLTAPAAVAQTPYDQDVPPPSAPIVPPPTPTPAPAPEPAPDVTVLPLDQVPLPAPGRFGAVAGTVDGQPATVVVRDPEVPIAPDDPILTLLPGAAVVGDGAVLLLPVGPAGSSREVAVRDSRIVTVGGVAMIIFVEDVERVVREQLPNGALASVAPDDAFVVLLGGLLPASLARLTLFSEPTDLGTFRVAADGTLTAVAPVPPGFPSGEHVLQVDAVRTDRALLSVGQLVDIAPVAAPAEPTVPAPAPTPAPTPPPAATPAPEPVEAATSRVPSLLLALGLLVLVLVARRYLARRRDDHDDIEHDAPAPSTPVGRSRGPLAGEPVRVVLLAVSAGVVMGVWTLGAGAALTRPRIESLVALVLLQWVGLRVITGPARGVRANGSSLADMLGAAAGLTLGTGLHLALDAFFDAVPLLSGVPGPHLTIPLTLAVLVSAVATMSGLIALRSRSDARDTVAARPSTGGATRDDA